MSERPVISFVVLTCDRAGFVVEAVQSALDQSYQPLEIIVSDDYSQDGAWETTCDLLRNYTGPHEVRLIRNEVRLGIVGNFNRAVAAARGELVVLGDGDDISHPTRVEKIWKIWRQTDGRVRTFCSTYIPIDAAGRPTRYSMQELFGEPQDGGEWYWAPPAPLRFLATHRPSLCGATLAFHRELFRALGPLPKSNWVQDLPMAFRGMLRGGIAIIREPLVQYRRHDCNMFSIPLMGKALRAASGEPERRALRERYRLSVLRLAGTYRAIREDVERAYKIGWLNRGRKTILRAEARRQELIYLFRGGLQMRLWPTRVFLWSVLLILGAPRWVLRDQSVHLLPDFLLERSRKRAEGQV